MSRVALIAVTLTVLGAVDIAESGLVGLFTLPQSDFGKISLLLKEALKPHPEEPQPTYLLRVRRRLIPGLIQSIAPGYKGPKLEQIYIAHYLTKDKKEEGLYKMEVGVTKEGKAVLWNPPDHVWGKKDLVEKTYKLLEKKDFDGVYKLWN